MIIKVAPRPAENVLRSHFCAQTVLLSFVRRGTLAGRTHLRIPRDRAKVSGFPAEPQGVSSPPWERTNCFLRVGGGVNCVRGRSQPTPRLTRGLWGVWGGRARWLAAIRIGAHAEHTLPWFQDKYPASRYTNIQNFPKVKQACAQISLRMII